MWYSIANLCFENAEKLENNWIEEISLVTPNPGPELTHYGNSISLIPVQSL